jgi:hypothetical protein
MCSSNPLASLPPEDGIVGVVAVHGDRLVHGEIPSGERPGLELFDERGFPDAQPSCYLHFVDNRQLSTKNAIHR